MAATAAACPLLRDDGDDDLIVSLIFIFIKLANTLQLVSVSILDRAILYYAMQIDRWIDRAAGVFIIYCRMGFMSETGIVSAEAFVIEQVQELSDLTSALQPILQV